MVKFLLDAGADQEHKTDEMHTALMEASMDGHVEVARLLLDHGAQVRWLWFLPWDEKNQCYHPFPTVNTMITLRCLSFLLGRKEALLCFLIFWTYFFLCQIKQNKVNLWEKLLHSKARIAPFFFLTVFQVNMPADSFESPLTLAACGGHVELADLLIKRGAFLEEVNDEGLVEGSYNHLGPIICEWWTIHCEKLLLLWVVTSADSVLKMSCIRNLKLIGQFLVPLGGSAKFSWLVWL